MKIKCPHCAHAIRFEEERAWLDRMPGDDEQQGYKLTYGECPNCDGLIVILQRGKYNTRGEYDYLSDITSVEILYPKTSAREPLPAEVTGEYRTDFEEAASVLSISPKASAAISRRLLQHTLQEKFGIQAPTLAREIDLFISRQDIPSHLSEAVDAVRTIGNFAAHPSKDTATGMVVDVEQGEAEWLLDTLEALLDFCIVQPQRLAERKQLLNAKLAALGKPPMKK
jgi:hypothetical protein